MDTKQGVQKLKAERVQEELMAEPVRNGLLFVDVADEPVWVSLKAERVQEPALFANSPNEKLSSVLELTVSQKQPMTIELPALGAIIKLHGTTADTSVPGGGSIPSSTGQPKAA
jgi:hypothetical protein